MTLHQRKPSGREKDAAAVVLLAQLRENLHARDISMARKAAFNLSWMQEDGLEILLEALFGTFPRTTKKAAAYGLRSMNGRMRKMAADALNQGLTSENRTTQEACSTALLLMKAGPAARKAGIGKRPRPRRPAIREIRGNRRGRSDSRSRNIPRGRSAR